MAEPNPDGNPTVDPWEGVDPSLRESPSIKDFKTPADVVKAYVNVQPLIGADKIVVPGEKATDDDWGKVYDRLGRPKSPDEYDFSATPIPEALAGEATAKMETNFKGLAHKLGLNAKQAAGLRDWFMSEQANGLTEFQASLDAAGAESAKALEAKWGDKYKDNFGTLQRLMLKFGGKEAADILTIRSPVVLGDSLPVLEMMLALAGSLSEDALRLPEDQKVNAASMQDATKKIETIMNDRAHAYWDKNPMNTEAHKAAVAEVARLHAIIHPEVAVQ